MPQAGPPPDPRDKHDARNPGVKPYGKYGWTDSDLEREERERRNADSGPYGGRVSGRATSRQRPAWARRVMKIR